MVNIEPRPLHAVKKDPNRGVGVHVTREKEKNFFFSGQVFSCICLVKIFELFVFLREK